MKKNKLNSDIFITPLTNRGYLLKIAFDRVCDIYFSSSSSYYLSKKDFSTTYSFNDFRLDYVHIMSIMYLYGSSFSNIHFPYDKKRKSSEIGNTSYALEPSFYFTKTDKPFTKKSNEIAIIKENLEKLGYTLWYPYSWTTEDGEKVRSVINPILDKKKNKYHKHGQKLF